MKENKMLTKPFSVYLDLLRFVAAMLVVLYHSNVQELTIQKAPMSDFGHSAVIIFFVLSGFVIAFVTDNKEKNIKSYTVSRLARIYSVAIPVLLITPFLDLAGEALNASFYINKTTYDYWYVRELSSLLFLNEIWFLSIMSFSNVPYWSLCYEIWYYAIFAILTFLSGLKKYFLLLMVCSLIGPKILILFPIWYFGVLIYRSKYLQNISTLTGATIWVLSIVLLYYFHEYNIQMNLANYLQQIVGDYWHKNLTFSKYFLSDYMLAVIIAMNFVGARASVILLKTPLLRIRSKVAYISSTTFILYLAHQPLLQFYSALLDGDPKTSFFYYQVLFLVLFTTWCLSYITEGKKVFWKNTFIKIVGKIEFIIIKLTIKKDFI